MEAHRTVRLAGLVEFLDVLSQCWTKPGSKNSWTVTGNFLLGRCNRFVELTDQPRTRPGKPAQMSAGIVEVLNGVTNRLDFYQTAESRAQEITLRKSGLLPPFPAPSCFCPRRYPLKQQRAHREG